jgi:hypothetical protein
MIVGVRMEQEKFMPLLSVPALYNGENIQLLEQAPVHEPYRVLVTFIEPLRESGESPAVQERFWASFGAWQDDKPVEATVSEIRQSRRSKAEPPAL